MVRAAQPLTIRIAHANVAVTVRPRPRVHVSLIFEADANRGFVARGVDIWDEGSTRPQLVGVGARLPRHVADHLEAVLAPRLAKIGSAVHTMLIDEFDPRFASRSLPYHALGMSGSPAPLGPLGGVGLQFRSPGAGDGSFALSASGTFSLRPRLDPLHGEHDGGPIHPASLDAHERWRAHWGPESARGLEEYVGPLAKQLLTRFRDLLRQEIPSAITIP